MDAVTHLAPTVGVLAACDVLGVARASFYRQRPLLGPPASPAALALPVWQRIRASHPENRYRLTVALARAF